MSAIALDDERKTRPMSAQERKVVLASSLGTVFEWYDFYLYGALAKIIGAQFFGAFPKATADLFAIGLVVLPETYKRDITG